MDQEALRKQLYEEIEAQFDAKLREAKRQKAELEEEIEQSSEKWRAERRRLNSEIDRLEAALAEARQTGRKAPDAKSGGGADPQDLAKIQAAAEEKVKKAAKDWEAEKTKLQAEVSRLQIGIADMIERSNNPLRSSQAEREKVDSRYDEAVRARRQAESALQAAKAEWEQEKVQLLRRPAAGLKPSGAGLQSDTQLQADLNKARLELSRIKESQSAELQDLTSKLERSRAEVKDLTDRLDGVRKLAEKERDDLQKRLRDSADARAKLERELEKVKQAAPADDGAQSAEIARLKQELEDARAAGNAADADEASRLVARFQAELEDAHEENKRLERRLAEGSVSANSDDVDGIRRQYEQRIDQLNEQLAEQIQKSAHASATPNGSGGGGVNTSALDAEVARIEEMIATIARLIDDPDTELSTVIRKNVERAELDAYLKGILFSLGRGQSM
jgi:chromosome segregation ATPase